MCSSCAEELQKQEQKTDTPLTCPVCRLVAGKLYVDRSVTPSDDTQEEEEESDRLDKIADNYNLSLSVDVVQDEQGQLTIGGNQVSERNQQLLQTRSWTEVRDGKVVQFSRRQTPVDQAYEHYKERYGKFIQDDDAADFRRFIMLQVARSTGDNPHYLEAIENAKTAAELDAIVLKRREETISSTDFIKSQEKMAGGANGQKIDTKAMNKAAQKMYQELQKQGRIKEVKMPARGVGGQMRSMAYRTAEERQSILDELSKEYEVFVVDKRPTDKTDSEYARLHAAAKQAERAISIGMAVDGTENPSDPDQKAKLEQQIRIAAQLRMESALNARLVAFCDKNKTRLFVQPASKLASTWADARLKCKRVDTVLPIVPDVIEALVQENMGEFNHTIIFLETVEHMFYTPQLYMLLVGAALERTVSFSHLYRFYAAVLKHLQRTDLRAKQKEVNEQRKTELERLKTLPGAIAVNENPIEDFARETHSREEICKNFRNFRAAASSYFITQMDELQKAMQRAREEQEKRKEFEWKSEEIIGCATCHGPLYECSCAERPSSDMAVDDPRSSLEMQLLLEVFRMTRKFSLDVIRSYEVAIMLYYEDYIPFSERAMLMTMEKVPCECCTPDIAREQFEQNTKMMWDVRKHFVISGHKKFGRRFNFGDMNLQQGTQHLKIDPLNSWSPTAERMLEFIKFIEVDMSTNPKFAGRVINKTANAVVDHLNKLRHKAEKINVRQ